MWRFGLLLSLLYSSTVWGQEIAIRFEFSVPVLRSATLWMNWERGHSHDGPDFIRLTEPCQNAKAGCVCRVRFATRSSEFADYISSLGENKVPVVYEVTYDLTGAVVAARLISVGMWTEAGFPAVSDGLIEISFTGEAVPRVVRRVSVPSDCFPNVTVNGQ
jgi:hypothetical protein